VRRKEEEEKKRITRPKKRPNRGRYSRAKKKRGKVIEERCKGRKGGGDFKEEENDPGNRDQGEEGFYVFNKRKVWLKIAKHAFRRKGKDQQKSPAAGKKNRARLKKSLALCSRCWAAVGRESVKWGGGRKGFVRRRGLFTVCQVAGRVCHQPVFLNHTGKAKLRQGQGLRRTWREGIR